jgi:Na+/H+ antiporter NhaD/arsenite permease-like protein
VKCDAATSGDSPLADTVMALSSTLAGNLLIVGSFANMIVAA